MEYSPHRIDWFSHEWEYPRKGVEQSTPWKPGMTEREFFNANLKCGDLPRSNRPIGTTMISAPPCGAADWRVIKLNIMAYNERSLQCQKCGYWTAVEAPVMREHGESI